MQLWWRSCVRKDLCLRPRWEWRMKLAKILVGMSVAASLGCAAVPACAVNKVAQLSGTLAVQRADGTIMLLSKNSAVDTIEMPLADRHGYDRIKINDGDLSMVKVEAPAKLDVGVFGKSAPKNDNLIYSVFKGSLRFLSGLISTLGSIFADCVCTSSTAVPNPGPPQIADNCTDEKNPCVNLNTMHMLPPGAYINEAEGSIIIADKPIAANSSLVPYDFNLGTIRQQGQNFEAGQRDNLNSERGYYAQVRMNDGRLVTMKPETRVKVFDEYNYDEKGPRKDSIAISLLKSGLCLADSLVGRPDAYNPCLGPGKAYIVIATLSKSCSLKGDSQPAQTD
jgi:hypothetical protein